jgi:uncharacterized protein with GYD domain
VDQPTEALKVVKLGERIKLCYDIPIKNRETHKMTRIIMLGSYSSAGLKGLISGSDRRAAVEALMAAVGGTCHDIHFTRGKYDVVVDCSLPSQEAVMGAVAAIKASGGFDLADYVEIVDIEAVKAEAQKIAKAYAPPNG